MAKKPSPNAKVNFPADGPAYVSWDGTKAERNDSLKVYTNAIQEAATASSYSSRNRNFSDLTTYMSGKPGLRDSDYDYFRPDQRVPEKHKDIIAFARAAYRRIGLIRNSIDLMGDFACQGVRLVHQNKRVEKFYNDWFTRVRGKETSERLCNLLFREANVPIRMRTAKINKQKRLEMQRSVASPDMNADIKISNFSKGEIPWQYSFIDPLTVEVVGGPIASMTGNRRYVIKLPTNISNMIRKLRNSTNAQERALLEQIPTEILQAAENNQSVLLPPDKTFVYFYKKDDWQEWADPMTYACFNDLILYERLKLADKTALDGAISKIRIFKLGSLDHKLAPTPAAASALQSILGANVGGGTTDIVWGPDIELLETGTDIQRFLGEEKYRPTLMAIYACLGIPPTLTGTFGASGTTNNFISLKTLTERLSYVRNTVLEFWNHQIKIVQEAMGFRFPAQVEFDFMYLDDPTAMSNLLLAMADRNIVSDEFVQRHIKAKPDIEQRRVLSENKARDTKNLEKVSPYHAVDKDYGLEKIALQTGVVSPSQVGVKLKDKDGDQSALELRRPKETTPSPPTDQEDNPGQPGRPKNSRDIEPRKQKEFKPKIKASVELWAKDAQSKISEFLNPGILKQFNKKNMRSLTAEEYNQAEQIKFSVLYTLDYLEPITEEVLQTVLAQKLSNGVIERCEEWISNAKVDINRKLSIEEIRNIRASFYAEHYIAEGKFAYKDIMTGEIYYYSRRGVYRKNGRLLVFVQNP